MTDTFDWKLYTGGIDWLHARTFFLTRAGSHAYGTSLPTSDIDLRGLCIAPRHYYTGFAQVFEQTVQHEPIDLTVFELRKFFKLAADANPNMLEILFTDPSDHLVTHPELIPLLDARALFLSRRVKHTFSGYARAQMKRINTHYRWLRDPPKSPPMRADFDLPERTVIPADQLAAAESAIRKQVDRWEWKELADVDPATRLAVQSEFQKRLLEITSWNWEDLDDRLWDAASAAVGYDTNFILLLDRERRYTAKLREWQNYQSWRKTRNPARAELEAKWGYDTKHAMHLVRLCRMCREILIDGTVNVRRPDAAELLEIRAGAWSYEQLVEYTDRQDAELEQLMNVSPLPRSPNLLALDALCMQIIGSRNG